MKTDYQGHDAKLKQLLQQHDPAGLVAAQACMRLEMAIAEQAAHLPQASARADKADYFIVPHLLNGLLSWPVTLAGTMALGLMLGIIMSSVTETRTTTYTLTTAMVEPWHQFTR